MISTRSARQISKHIQLLFTSNSERRLLNAVSFEVRRLETVSKTNLINSIEHQIRAISTSTLLKSKTKTMSGEGDHETLNLDYDGLLKAQKETDTLIIDVRENEEIAETGKLPGSIHIPMGNIVEALNNYSDEAFLKIYEKPKPAKDTKLVFSCRSGKRSSMVQELVQKLGYEKCYNYSGGWLDWESKQAS